MSLEDVLNHEDLGVAGDNTGAGDISTESFGVNLSVVPAHRKLLTDYLAYQETAGVVRDMQTIDKAFAVESMAMLPVFMTQSLSRRLTTNSSAANRAIVSQTMSAYETNMTEHIKDISTDIYLVVSDLVCKVREKQSQIQFYADEISVMRDTFAGKTTPVLVLSRGKTHDLAKTSLSEVEYSIDDMAVMYKPFEGKLNDAARSVLYTYRTCGLDKQTANDDVSEADFTQLMGRAVTNLNACLTGLEHLSEMSKTLDHDASKLLNVISSIETTDIGLKYFTCGQDHLDALIAYGKLLLTSNS